MPCAEPTVGAPEAKNAPVRVLVRKRHPWRGAAYLGRSCENARVEIEIIGPIENPDDDNVDVLLRLDDGRVYSFLVATPKNIYWCMQNESLDYWFGEPPVFVRTLTVEAIEKALRAIVNEDEGNWLPVYGTRQCAI